MNSNDYFASLLGDKPGPKPRRRTTVVTPNTIAKVRQEQAADAFAAERAELTAAQDALKDELDAQREACESLARDLTLLREEATAAKDAAAAETATLLARAESAESACAAVRAELEAERAKPHLDDKILEESAAKDREIARLQELLADAQRTSLSSSVLLEKPPALSEKFAGEIREHVLAALADSHAAAEAGGRDRRARILEAVLCANPASGELESRREAVRQIVKDAGSFLDDRAIASLEKLGFRYVSGKNHHKLEWAGIRFPMAKTPSDHRSCLNSAAEIANRVF